MSNSPHAAFPQPLDRAAIICMLVLSLLVVLLLFGGDRTAPRVRNFSWQNRQVGADDTAFLLTFSRPMDHASVEKGLKIEPPLVGKTSWAGRRMAYTLTTPAPYGKAFQVQIQNATDRLNGAGVSRAVLQPFEGKFNSRDRAFAYIGVDGEEEGRLILFNVTRDKKEILTPKELIVGDFEPYSLGDRILFAASPRTAQTQGLLEQKLYTATTGIQVKPPLQIDSTAEESGERSQAAPAGKVDLVLDSGDYQNLKFDLSQDGKIIVVQRVNRKDPADFGPWILRDGQKPQPLRGEPGGEFLITPDSNSLAIAQGQGLAIVPLQPDAKPLNFLSQFARVLGFSKDGSLAAMLKFNGDRTRSLFLVTAQGTQKELFRTTGSILSAQFDPTRQTLYCLLTELEPGEVYQEQPYLAAIDLKTTKPTALALLPPQQDIQVSLSPDGLALLLDQTVEKNTDGKLRGRSGRAIATSQLWLLPLDTNNSNLKPKPEALPLLGLRPKWIP